MKNSFFLLLVCFLSVMCSKPPVKAPDKPSFDTQITEKYWKLVSVPGYTLQTGFTREPHMILRSNATSFKGNGGCNAFSGSYETGKDETITFFKITSATTDTCSATESEQVFLKILEVANRFNLNRDTLILFRDDHSLARFETVYFK